jgi:choline transport protein
MDLQGKLRASMAFAVVFADFATT